MQESPRSPSPVRVRRGLALALLLASTALFACGKGDGDGAGGSPALARGRERARAGQHAAALQEYQAALSGGEDTAELKLAIAQSLFALDRFGEASSVLKSAAATYPDNAEIALHLGTVYLKMSSLELAARELERATQLDPSSKIAFLYLGRARYDRSILLLGTTAIDQVRLDSSIAAFQSALALDPDDVEVHYRLALAYDRKHQDDEAIGELEAVTRRMPSHVAARRMLGRLLVARGDVERGKQELTAALELAPEDAETHYELGVAFEESDDDASALKAYSSAVEIKPVYHEAYFRQSAVLRRAGREEDADRAQLLFEHWETKDRELSSKRLAAMAAPDDAVKQVDFGMALLELMRMDEARATLLRSIELNPNIPRARYALGRILMKEKDLEGARKQFEALNQLEPDSANGLAELAQVCVLLGDLDAARRVLGELVVLRPEEAEAHVRLADLSLRADDRAGARTELEAALGLEPDNASATFNLGSLELMEGNRDEAVRLWTRTLELDPEHPKAKAFLEKLRAAREQEGE